MQENKQISETKKFISHWWRKKRADRNELTMAQEHNETRRRREEH